MTCTNCGIEMDIQPIQDMWGSPYCSEDCKNDFIQRTRGTLVHREEQLFLFLKTQPKEFVV